MERTINHNDVEYHKLIILMPNYPHFLDFTKYPDFPLDKLNCNPGENYIFFQNQIQIKVDRYHSNLHDDSYLAYSSYHIYNFVSFGII